MAEVIGVRFKEVGKIYYFDPQGKEYKAGVKVIVETARGIECGEVALGNKIIPEDEIVSPLKTVIRTATENDLKVLSENREKEKEAFEICSEKIINHKLDMKLVEAE